MGFFPGVGKDKREACAVKSEQHIAGTLKGDWTNWINSSDNSQTALWGARLWGIVFGMSHKLTDLAFLKKMY